MALTLGLTVGWVFGASQLEASRPDPTALPGAPPLSSTTTTVRANEGSESSVSVATLAPRRLNRPELELLPGTSALAGEVALFGGSGSGEGTLHVFRPGGSLVRREEVPFQIGDFVYPILLTRGSLVFTDLHSAFVLDSDLVDSPDSLGEASYVVPGAQPGLVWLVDDTWVAPLEVESGTVGDRYDAGEFSEALAGVADGLIVAPIDQDTYGQIAYWTAADGLLSIDLAYDPPTGALAAAENMTVVATPDFLQILNVGDGSAPNTFPIDLSEERVNDVCLSPGLRYVAIVGGTGVTVLVNTSDGEVVRTLSDVSTWNGIGWTSPDQFVYLADLPGGTLLQVLDVSTGEIQAIASLRLSGGGWLAASGSMC